MPVTIRDDNQHYAVDTSVAVAALDASHEAHAVCRAASSSYRPALAGHTAFEVYSVLTRLPGEAKIDPSTASEIIERAFPARCWLSARQQDAVFRRLAEYGFAGGTVYDALVAEAARVHRRILLTRDLRASRTYELIGAHYDLVV